MLPPGTIDPDREVADEIAHRFFPDVKDHKHTGLEIAITNALKTRGEAGRQEGLERAASVLQAAIDEAQPVVDQLPADDPNKRPLEYKIGENIRHILAIRALKELPATTKTDGE